MARAEIALEVLNTIFCPGQVQENPASSCLEVSLCNPQLPSEYYWIACSNGTAVQVYCDMTRECSCSSASIGGWSRVAYLNMTDPTHQCPPAWREITEPVISPIVMVAAAQSLSALTTSHFLTFVVEL